jgi:stringent starvation protein B
MSSTKPYLIRALHEWCTDNGFTPYIAVAVDHSVVVPSHVVSNQEVVLNIGYEATGGLQLGNELITFKARFNGAPKDISVPIGRVLAIYARENGEGMAFPVSATDQISDEKQTEQAALPLQTSANPHPPSQGLSLVTPESDLPDNEPPPSNSSPTVRTLRRIK